MDTNVALCLLNESINNCLLTGLPDQLKGICQVLLVGKIVVKIFLCSQHGMFSFLWCKQSLSTSDLTHSLTENWGSVTCVKLSSSVVSRYSNNRFHDSFG